MKFSTISNDNAISEQMYDDKIVYIFKNLINMIDKLKLK